VGKVGGLTARANDLKQRTLLLQRGKPIVKEPPLWDEPGVDECLVVANDFAIEHASITLTLSPVDLSDRGNLDGEVGRHVVGRYALFELFLTLEKEFHPVDDGRQEADDAVDGRNGLLLHVGGQADREDGVDPRENDGWNFEDENPVLQVPDVLPRVVLDRLCVIQDIIERVVDIVPCAAGVVRI